MSARKAALVFGLASFACEPRQGPAQQASNREETPPPALVSAAVSASATVRDEPVLANAGELVALIVEGFKEAVVAVPASAPAPRPLLLATHGNFDTPESQCEEWRAVVRDRAFVLCPRGEPRPDSPSNDDIRFTYASNETLERETAAGIAALEARFAPHVDASGAVYTGFSLGAIQGTKIAARNPSRYPRLILVEGGHDTWTRERAKAYGSGGGKRVLFVCGGKGCEILGKQASKLLEKEGVAARTVLVDGVGHSYGGPMSDAIRENLEWVVEGDARWKK
jgi:predicted esterase